MTINRSSTVNELGGISITSDFPGQIASLVRYGGAGALGTAIHFAILGFVSGLTGPVAASTLGAIVGCAVNFTLVRHFVFETGLPARYSFPRFGTVAIFGIAVNAVVLSILVARTPLFVAQGFASGSVLVIGYLLNKRWSFNER